MKVSFEFLSYLLFFKILDLMDEDFEWGERWSLGDRFFRGIGEGDFGGLVVWDLKGLGEGDLKGLGEGDLVGGGFVFGEGERGIVGEGVFFFFIINESVYLNIWK